MRRGSLYDYVTAPLLIIIVSLVVLISFKIMRVVNSSGAFDVTSDSKDLMNTYTTKFQKVDLFPLFLFIAWVIALCVSGLFAPANPVLFVVYLFMAIVSVFVSGPVMNVYIDSANSAALNDTSTYLTITNNLATQ